MRYDARAVEINIKLLPNLFGILLAIIINSNAKNIAKNSDLINIHTTSVFISLL